MKIDTMPNISQSIPPSEKQNILYMGHTGALISPSLLTSLAPSSLNDTVVAIIPIMGSISRTRFFTLGSFPITVNVSAYDTKKSTVNAYTHSILSV